jgi:hypothetical protein
VHFKSSLKTRDSALISLGFRPGPVGARQKTSALSRVFLWERDRHGNEAAIGFGAGMIIDNMAL